MKGTPSLCMVMVALHRSTCSRLLGLLYASKQAPSLIHDAVPHYYGYFLLTDIQEAKALVELQDNVAVLIATMPEQDYKRDTNQCK